MTTITKLFLYSLVWLYATQANAQDVIFSGSIKQAGNRAPIANAAIIINKKFVAQSDAQGKFAISHVALGPLNIEIKHPGYETLVASEILQDNERIEANYYLQILHNNPFETVVTSKIEQQDVSKIQLSRQEVEKVPGSLGDPIKVLEDLPGVGRSLGGFGAALLIRGANPEDTTVLIDGVPISLLYHFFGLTSVVNAEFLDRVDFYTGGFGARYGDAIAGVVDIITRKLDCDMWHGTAKVDLLDAKAYTCVPIGSWKIAMGIRRSYIDVILSDIVGSFSAGKDKGGILIAPIYLDYQAKAETQYNNHAIDIFAFGSNDNISVIQTGGFAHVHTNSSSQQGFHRLIIKDKWKINQATTLQSVLSPGYLISKIGNQASDVGVNQSFNLGVYVLTWREDLFWNIDKNISLHVGIDDNFGDATLSLKAPINTQLQDFPSPTSTLYSTNTQALHISENSFSQAYWSELVMHIDNLQVIPGLRVENFAFGSESSWVVLPRMVARFAASSDITLKASYGLYAEAPQPQYLTASIGNPKLKPERAQQYVAGLEYQLQDLLFIDTQLFYNARTDLVETSNHTSLTNGKSIAENYINSGTSNTKGFEILLRSLPSADRLYYGWLSYTLSQTLQRDHPVGSSYSTYGVSQLYNSIATSEHPSTYDQRHILTLIGQFKLPQGFEAGFRFRLVSGNTYTSQTSGTIFWDSDLDAYQVDLSTASTNGSRYPIFQELDLRIDKTWTYDIWRLTAYIEVLNAYNAKNVDIYQYDYRFREKTAITLLPIIPNIGIKGDF